MHQDDHLPFLVSKHVMHRLSVRPLWYCFALQANSVMRCILFFTVGMKNVRRCFTFCLLLVPGMRLPVEQPCKNG